MLQNVGSKSSRNASLDPYCWKHVVDPGAPVHLLQVDYDFLISVRDAEFLVIRSPPPSFISIFGRRARYKTSPAKTRYFEKISPDSIMPERREGQALDFPIFTLKHGDC